MNDLDEIVQNKKYSYNEKIEELLLLPNSTNRWKIIPDKPIRLIIKKYIYLIYFFFRFLINNKC